MKYSAWQWLEAQPSLVGPDRSQAPQFEQRIFLPGPEIYVGGEPEGDEFDDRYAQLLAPGELVFYGDGRDMKVDVFGKGYSIEVGQTEPSSLLYPPLFDLSELAVWIPFPRGIKPKDFQLDDYEFESVIGYVIEV